MAKCLRQATVISVTSVTSVSVVWWCLQHVRIGLGLWSHFAAGWFFVAVRGRSVWLEVGGMAGVLCLLCRLLLACVQVRVL